MRTLARGVETIIRWQPDHNRVFLQIGDQTFTCRPAEAIHLANCLVDAVEKGTPND